MDFNLTILWISIQDLFLTFVDRLPQYVLGLLVFIVSYLASKGVRGVVRGAILRYGFSEGVAMAMGRLSQWGVILLGSMAALSVALESFNAGELIQILGISSVAIGFAFKDILQNFLAGLILLFTEPFKVGDQIIADDVEGTITYIDTRATKIKTYDGRQVVIPNVDLFINKVTINTAYPIRRQAYDFGIGYGEDIDKASEIVLAVLRDLPEVLEDPAPKIRVWELGDFAVNIRALWWAASRRSDVSDVRSMVNQRVLEALTEEGIDMPYPTQVVQVPGLEQLRPIKDKASSMELDRDEQTP